MSTIVADVGKWSAPSRARLPGWVPLVVLTITSVLFCGHVAPWELMWIVAVAIFAGFKWWTWWNVIQHGTVTPMARSLMYLSLWPGMDARRFLAKAPHPEPIGARDWIGAVSKIMFGATLVWGVARLAGNGLLAGWIGMVGFIFLLHFGLFAMLSLYWRAKGIIAPPLMNCPIAASSLADFWGRRWNSGFRDIVFGLFFFPMARRWGATIAMLLTFLISGALHELVITVPAGGAYGLPTLYFLLQGVALLVERRWTALFGGWRGHAFAMLVVIGPIFALFPPIFVLRVMVPFFQIIQALP